MRQELEQFDAIVIGTGQAGKPLATALADAGRETAILERRHVGGSCINFGCTPTKTMAASARIAGSACFSMPCRDNPAEISPVSASNRGRPGVELCQRRLRKIVCCAIERKKARD